MVKGVVIRHMILPNNVLNSKMVLKNIAKLFKDDAMVSVMAQYFPTGNAAKYPEINRKITKEELESILKSSKKILNEAIKYNGTTIKSFTSAYHQKGSYQNYLMVHTKNKCSICNSNIIKTKINGRSTYYCEVCQKVQK